MATKAEQVHADTERKGPNPQRVRKLQQRKNPHAHHGRRRSEKNPTYRHPEWKRFRERRNEGRATIDEGGAPVPVT